MAFLSKLVYNFAFTFSLPMYTMVYRVVSTKLTEEEHTKFLDFCNKKGNSPSAIIKQAILKSMEEKPKRIDELTMDEAMKLFYGK